MAIRLILCFLLAGLSSGCVGLPDCSIAATCGADGRLAQEVLARIDESPALKGDHLRVQSYAGVVYLYGIVESFVEYYSAEEIARRVPHVVKVVNELSLTPSNEV